MMLTLTMLAVLTQADAPAATTSERSAAERAADAAEKAAQAAEKAATAAQRIAEAVAPAPEAAKPAGAPSAWVGTVGAGLQFLTGNTQTLTLTANLALDRKWDDWRLGIKLNGAYALSNPRANETGTTSDTTARRAQGIVRGDRTFGSFASIFVLGGSEFDHVKNIESRSFGELGTGLTFFDTKGADQKEKLYVRLDLAMRGGYETRFQYFPVLAPVPNYDLVVLAPRAALALRWNFNAHVRVSQDLEFLPFVLAPEAGRLLLNSTTKLSAAVTESVSLTTSVLVNYDSRPPSGATPANARLSTDVALTAGLEASF
jgi:putative salt-induced outer membrane protein YdiY